jgi:hypothetical protein
MMHIPAAQDLLRFYLQRELANEHLLAGAVDEVLEVNGFRTGVGCRGEYDEWYSGSYIVGVGRMIPPQTIKIGHGGLLYLELVVTSCLRSMGACRYLTLSLTFWNGIAAG